MLEVGKKEEHKFNFLNAIHYGYFLNRNRNV